MPIAEKNVATTVQDATRIVPRAEFRVFGHDVIEVVKTRMWNGKTVLLQARRMPPETYILSKATNDANVKVRDGLLDIKVRIATTPDGYEVFQPMGKFQFPVEASAVRDILRHLRATVASDRDVWTFQDFVDAARRSPDLVPVRVEKMRHGFTIDGVICEYAQVWFNGALMESACVESDNYAAMRDVIAGLGLADFPNVNYLLAAKRVVGLETL
jgi:hypothetical protein